VHTFLIYRFVTQCDNGKRRQVLVILNSLSTQVLSRLRGYARNLRLKGWEARTNTSKEGGRASLALGHCFWGLEAPGLGRLI